MGLAQRYLCWKAMKALLLAAPAFIGVMTLTHAAPVLEYHSRGMVDLGELLMLLALWVPMMAYLALPMVMPLAIGYAYATALQDREIAVMQAAGFSTRLLVAPGIAAALAGALVCAAMSLYFVPEAFLEFRERTFLAEKNAGPRAMRENEFTTLKPGAEIYFQQRISANEVRNAIVFIRDGAILTAITGRVAVFRRIDGRLNIVFHDGYLTRTPEAGSRDGISAVRFATHAQELTRVYSADDLGERGWGFFERHIGQLLSPPDPANLSAEDHAEWAAEGLKRILHPILCILYSLVAIALALARGQGRRGEIPDIMLRLIALLILLHPAFLIGVGVLGRTPALPPSVIFVYPALVLAGALYAFRRLSRAPRLRTSPRARHAAG